MYFDFGKTTLNRESKAKMDSLCARLFALGADSIHLEGHTDAIGSHAANQRISDRRTKSVERRLGKCDSLEVTITRIGRGKREFKVPNNSNANRALNRRVEIVYERDSIARQFADMGARK